MTKNEITEQSYLLTKEMYAEIGIDVDAAISKPSVRHLFSTAIRYA